jgi:hypothetical protein
LRHAINFGQERLARKNIAPEEAESLIDITRSFWQS